MWKEASTTTEFVTQTMSNNREAEGLAIAIECKDGVVSIQNDKGPAMGFEFKDWVIEIQNDAKSVNLCEEEKNWTMTSIYRVPSFIKDIREEPFTPEVVSFGPYHHNADRLRPVEQHKHRALAHLLYKAGKPLEEFIQAMRSIEKQLQDCYHNLDNKWKDPEHPDQFVMLMILDGCFMLEVLRMKKDGNYIKHRYAEHDPVFSSYGVDHRLPYIKRDMLVMENQLPLLVLKKLLEVEGCELHNDDSINKLVLQFFGRDLKADMTGLGLHPLDVYRRSLLHPKRTPAPVTTFYEHKAMRSAVELHKCGVKFKKSETNSFADIDFKNGILTLPKLEVDDSTEVMLLNIVAFEHLHVGLGTEITSYVSLMDEIIDSEEDVRLLHRKGITKNATGSNKEIAELFGRLSKEVTVDPKNRLTYVRWLVHEHCKSKRNVWQAVLRHRYFHTPWSVIALIAATLAILLTGAQTFYSIYQYYHPKK